MKRFFSFLLLLTLLSGVSSAFAADPVKVERITLNESSITLALQKSAAVKATVEPKNATNKKLVWSSSDDNVATVTNGKITGTGVGTAVITAAAEDGSGAEAAVEVTVIIPVKKITLSETKQLPLAPLVPWRVTAQVEPESATDRNLRWSSSDEKIATVDEKGVVTGVTPGTATITASAADGFGAKAALKVKVGRYDLVFESMASQNVFYTFNPGYSHIRGKVKTGNVRIPELDTTIFLIGSPGTESISVTPVKAGPDEVIITGGARKYVYKVFVSPALFPESGAAVIPEENGEQPEILFLNIPWGTSYPEVKTLLQGQGKKMKAPAQRNDFIRATIDGGITFSNCETSSVALDFSYTPGTANFKEENSLFKATLYFDPEIPFDQIRMAVMSVYGLDNGTLRGNICTWESEGTALTLTPKDRYTILEMEKK